MNFAVAVAYHFCLSLPTAFSQPGRSLLADPCNLGGLMHACLTSLFHTCSNSFDISRGHTTTHHREFARCRDDNWYLRLLCRNFSWGLSAKTRSHSKVADASPYRSQLSRMKRDRGPAQESCEMRRLSCYIITRLKVPSFVPSKGFMDASPAG